MAGRQYQILHPGGRHHYCGTRDDDQSGIQRIRNAAPHQKRIHVFGHHPDRPFGKSHGLIGRPGTAVRHLSGRKRGVRRYGALPRSLCRQNEPGTDRLCHRAGSHIRRCHRGDVGKRRQRIQPEQTRPGSRFPADRSRHQFRRLRYHGMCQPGSPDGRSPEIGHDLRIPGQRPFAYGCRDQIHPFRKKRPLLLRYRREQRARRTYRRADHGQTNRTRRQLYRVLHHV